MARAKKRNDGYYTVTLTIGTDEDGKAKRKYFYSKISRKDAIAKRNAWMQEHPYDEHPSEKLEALTVEQWAERWKQGYKSVLDDNTKKMYTTQVNGICDFTFASGVRFGSMMLADVKPLHINDIVNGLAGYSKSTISKRKLTLDQMFNAAVENGLIAKSPVGKMPSVKGTYTGHKALTRKEISRVSEQWQENRFGLGIMTMLWAGLRLGEVCALKWENIDLRTDTIHVVESRDVKAGKDKDTKTVNSVRNVPIFPQLHVALASVPEAQRKGYLCLSAHGQPMTNTAVRKVMPQFTKLVDADFTAHDLRITFATICYDAKVDVQTTAKWMGHSDVTTTMKIYTKLSEEQYEESREKMAEFSRRFIPRPVVAQ